MINLATIIDKLELKVLTAEKDFSQISVKNGYTSDLLSCVIAGAPNQSI